MGSSAGYTVMGVDGGVQLAFDRLMEILDQVRERRDSIDQDQALEVAKSIDDALGCEQALNLPFVHLAGSPRPSRPIDGQPRQRYRLYVHLIEAIANGLEPEDLGKQIRRNAKAFKHLYGVYPGFFYWLFPLAPRDWAKEQQALIARGTRREPWRPVIDWPAWDETIAIVAVRWKYKTASAIEKAVGAIRLKHEAKRASAARTGGQAAPPHRDAGGEVPSPEQVRTPTPEVEVVAQVQRHVAGPVDGQGKEAGRADAGEAAGSPPAGFSMMPHAFTSRVDIKDPEFRCVAGLLRWDWNNGQSCSELNRIVAAQCGWPGKSGVRKFQRQVAALKEIGIVDRNFGNAKYNQQRDIWVDHSAMQFQAGSPRLSFAPIPYAFTARPEIDDGEHRVVAGLIKWAWNDERPCLVPNEKIVEQCGWTVDENGVRKLQYRLASLRQRGLVTETWTSARGGTKRSLFVVHSLLAGPVHRDVHSPVTPPTQLTRASRKPESPPVTNLSPPVTNLGN